MDPAPVNGGGAVASAATGRTAENAEDSDADSVSVPIDNERPDTPRHFGAIDYGGRATPYPVNKSVERLNDFSAEDLRPGIQSTDRLVGVTKPPLMKKIFSKHKYIIILQAVLIVLMVIALCTVSIMYAKTHDVKTNNHVCLAPNCIRTASYFLRTLDQSVNPCDDFYSYVCGNWEYEMPNRGWLSEFSVFEAITERLIKEIHKAFSKPAPKNEPLPVKLSRNFYNSCLDYEQKNKLKYEPILDVLAEIGMPQLPASLNLTFNTSSENFDWAKTEARLAKTFQFDFIIGFDVFNNYTNRTYNGIYLGVPSGGVLPSPLKLKSKLLSIEDEEDIEYVEGTMKILIHYILNSTDLPGLEETLKAVILDMANITQRINELADFNTTDTIDHEKYTVDQIQNRTNEKLIENGMEPNNVWRAYFTELFAGILNETIDFERELIYVKEIDLEYLVEAVVFISSQSNETLEFLYWWVAVQNMVLSTTSEMQRLYIEYLGVQAKTKPL